MGVISNLKTLIGSTPPTPPPQGSSVPSQATNPPLKVLIVEDDFTLREFYAELMKSQGYEALVAENGQIGLDMAVKHKPNLILLDIMMPVMDGKVMLHELRKLPQFKFLPVIILTNAGDVNTMRETTVYDNANGFLVKSNVTPEDVLNKVKELI